MKRIAGWWTSPQAFILYFIGCGLVGVGLIVASTYKPSGAVASVILQGIGIALVSTATVAAPISLYGNSLFISQLRELTVDKLLEMRLAPGLAHELRRETFDADMYDNFRWRISLEPVAGQPDMLMLYSRRDYTISNRTYRTRLLNIAHSEDAVALRTDNFAAGYRGISMVLGSLEDPVDKKEISFDASPLELEARRFLGRPIKIQHGRWAVMLSYELELPPRSYFTASIASEGYVHISGLNPFICDRPSSSLEVTVLHHPDVAVGVLELNNPEGETLDPQSTSAPDRSGFVEDNWTFRRGFFPGHGIQLSWALKRLLDNEADHDASPTAISREESGSYLGLLWCDSDIGT